MKKFSDLVWGKANGRDEAVINFENGYGVAIWRMTSHRMEGLPFAGALYKNGELRTEGGYFPLQWKDWMTEEGVTEYMQEVQLLEKDVI